eukprot:g6187.t1
MQRLSKLILKSHGACRAYLARLRDAFFMVHMEDLAGVEAALRLVGRSPAEIEEKKKCDWGYFLQKCRRVIPPAAVLVKRFDLINRIYGNLLDRKMKQPLFRAEALEAIKRLRVHIEAGCLSDPPGVPLCFEAGKLAHLLLLEHNYRWNLRQAVRNRGLDPAIGGIYDQPVLEAVQRMTSMLFRPGEVLNMQPDGL